MLNPFGEGACGVGDIDDVISCGGPWSELLVGVVDVAEVCVVL